MCKLSHHVCANDSTICLPAEKLCDGTDDCPDGSDEKLCGKRQQRPDCALVSKSKSMHLQSSASAVRQLCAAVRHVSPLIFLSSTDLCSLDNGDCSHNCTVAPGEGVICSCPLGMELGPDNKTCQIQSFCAKHLKCSQRCEQDKFSAKCSCYEGWELEPDMENCKSMGKGGGRSKEGGGGCDEGEE